MNTNNQELKDLQKVITEAQAKIDKMVSEAEAKKSYMPWVPVFNEIYWVVNGHGIVVGSTWINDGVGMKAVAIGNAFKTKEEAEDHATFLKADTKIVNRIKELNEGWVADFEDELQGKTYILWDVKARRFVYSGADRFQHHNVKYYLRDDFAARNLIRDISYEDLKIVFGVKV